MIEITVKRGKSLNIEIKGHAGYEEHGKDIICSSVSIMAEALNHWGNWSPACWINESKLEPGDAKIVLYPTIKGHKEFVAVIDSYIEGMKLIADAYPKYVRLHDCGGEIL